MPALVGKGKSVLEVTEHALGRGKRQGHGAQFSNKFLPILDRRAVASGRIIRKEFLETGKAAGGQGDHHVFGVDEPAQDFLAGAPRRVTFAEFLDRDGFTAIWVVCRGQWSEGIINGVEQKPSDVL